MGRNTTIIAWLIVRESLLTVRTIVLVKVTTKTLNSYTSLAAKGALAHCLQRRTASIIQNGHQGALNGRRGLERCLPLGFWHSKQLSLNKFFDRSIPSMRNVDNGEKKKKRKRKEKEKKKDFKGF